jgi:hypothetical protein
MICGSSDINAFKEFNIVNVREYVDEAVDPGFIRTTVPDVMLHCTPDGVLGDKAMVCIAGIFSRGENLNSVDLVVPRIIFDIIVAVED